MGYEIFVIEKDQDGNEIQLKESHASWNNNDGFVVATGQTVKELLDGKKCSETTGALTDIIRMFGVDHGSTGACANGLLGLALSYPNAYWEIV